MVPIYLDILPAEAALEMILGLPGWPLFLIFRHLWLFCLLQLQGPRCSLSLDPMSPGATPSLSCFLSIPPLSAICSEQSPSQNFQFLLLELPFLWS